uniref:Xylulose kinase-1 n=1 Tax=Tanacetum cinerariifolium TaxID=118510 RepID=A0A6L2KNC0_TANCI|nr:xylulose kinase-1 [Tanacetum cinerariifolium]
MMERQMQSRGSKVVSNKTLDASLVVTECSWTKSDERITSSCSGTYITHVVDADIRPVNDQKPSTEVHLTAQHNVLANEQLHTGQFEPSYDKYLLENVDSNTTPDSTNMCHRKGEIDQDVEHDQEESFQSNKPCKNLDSPDFHEFFEINELKAQLQAKNSTSNNLKKQIKNVYKKSNEAKVKHDTDVIETINIELEHKVAKLRKLVLQPFRNQSITRQPAAFRSEQPKFSRPRFTSQVDVNNVLSKPVTPYYLSKVRKSMFVNPNHVIASGSSRNSSKELYGSNDMAHNYYLEEAKKKTQDDIINLKPSMMHTTSLQNTTNGCKPKPRSNNQTSRSLPVPKSSHGMLNGVTLVDHSRFSPNKSFTVHEKPNTPRSCLRWKSTGRIFKTAGLRWIPTGKMFIDCTTKVDSEPLNVQASLFNDKMASADNTSGPALQRKESCTLQCVLSLKEENPSYLRAVLSTTSISSHACSVNNVAQPVLVAVVQEPVVSIGIPSLTRTDQDTPSTSMMLPVDSHYPAGRNSYIRDLVDLAIDTAEEVVDRERETKAMITLLMALPEDHFAKFHKMADAKEMWEAIKSRFGGNDESKKMQKYLLKQQFEGFSVSASEGLHKGYDRKTKPGLDTLSFDDLYNNLRVFKRDVKGTTASSSSSNTQNVAFMSADNTRNTNDVAMISMRIKKFHKRTGKKLQFDTKDLVSFDKTKVECFNCHKIRHFARDCRAKGNQDSRRRDGGYNGNKARDNSRVDLLESNSKRGYKGASIRSEGHNITWKQYFTSRMIKRFTVADDLKESSKITQVKGTMLKDHYLTYKDST